MVFFFNMFNKNSGLCKYKAVDQKKLFIPIYYIILSGLDLRMNQAYGILTIMPLEKEKF